MRKKSLFRMVTHQYLVLGIPKPSLSWWYNNTIIDGVVDSSEDKHVTVNQLLIANLSRQYFGAHLQCRASSLEIADSIIKEISVIVYCKYIIL